MIGPVLIRIFLKTRQVRVSIGPDASGTCHRVYKWPPMGEVTFISFNFAQTRTSDSLLFYWPSSITVSISTLLASGHILELKVN